MGMDRGCHDPDDDNDGYSDIAEIAYGSDPRDANSVADTLPTDLTLSGLTVMENQLRRQPSWEVRRIDP